MSEKGKNLEFTELYFFVRGGTIGVSSLNAKEWLSLVDNSLESCKTILRRVVERRGGSMTMEAILNHQIEGCYGENRITPKEVMDTLPKSLVNTRSWIFMPIEILETKEEKGQFFERRLFILADLAQLMIVDTTFRKDPQLDQKLLSGTVPKINENVVRCQIYMDEALSLTGEGFKELILPYFADSKMNLGEKIIRDTLDYAVSELREMRNAVSKTEKEMQEFLKIRERLGYINCL